MSEPRRKLSWLERLFVALAAPLLRGLIRLLLASCRIQRIDGDQHLQRLIDNGTACLPCCWHQRLSVCVGHLLRARDRGLKPGFLISPSRDGEMTARVVAPMGASILRGSATHTGARALRDLHNSIRNGISPIIHPDGPQGPAFQTKPGSLMLARITGAPLLPMAFSADRYWQFGSWDKLILPKPFARVVILIGEPISVARGDDIDTHIQELDNTLNALAADADAIIGATPRQAKD